MARRYTRDNRGRFSSVGATARGGRLATATGNKRATQTAKLSGGGPKGTVGKPKGLKPGAIKPRAAAPAKGSLAANKMEMAKGRSAVLGKQKDSLNKQLREVNAKIKEAGPSAGAYRLQKLQIQSRLSETRSSLRQSQSAARGDTASVNRPMAGARGRQLDREISRNVKAQKAAERAESKARNRQFKSDQSRAKALRTAHVGAIAKAKGLSKGQVESALKAQSPSVQIKALKNWVRDNRQGAAAAKPAVAKPAAAKGRTIGHSEAYARRTEAQLRRGIETGKRAQAYLSSKDAYKAPIGSKLSNAWGKAGRVEWGSRNALNSIANKRLNEARKKRTGGFS